MGLPDKTSEEECIHRYTECQKPTAEVEFLIL